MLLADMSPFQVRMKSGTLHQHDTPNWKSLYMGSTNRKFVENYVIANVEGQVLYRLY